MFLVPILLATIILATLLHSFRFPFVVTQAAADVSAAIHVVAADAIVVLVIVFVLLRVSRDHINL